MNLGAFLEERSRDPVLGSRRRQRICDYRHAVGTLVTRIQHVLEPFAALGLGIEPRTVFLWEHAHPYNARGVSLCHQGDEILIEPLGVFGMEVEGRVRMRGRGNPGSPPTVHLDWRGGEVLWDFQWVQPATSSPAELTDAAIEDLVEGLLHRMASPPPGV